MAVPMNSGSGAEQAVEYLRDLSVGVRVKNNSLRRIRMTVPNSVKLVQDMMKGKVTSSGKKKAEKKKAPSRRK